MVTSTRSVQRFVYSQAYYLDLVKHTLRARNSLNQVASLADAEELRTGDFVEYTAKFRSNEMHSLLDILTPDLDAAITYYHARSQGIHGFDAFDDFEATKIFSLKNVEEANAKADLARSIAEAVQVDFRSQHTREFNGLIGDGGSSVTAVTICDNAHFVVEDEDRILDGNFTVLGKVAAPLESDVPVFARNKLLERLNPEAVDEVFAEIKESVADTARQIEQRRRGGPAIAQARWMKSSMLRLRHECLAHPPR